jgi:hypothetical protein
VADKWGLSQRYEREEIKNTRSQAPGVLLCFIGDMEVQYHSLRGARKDFGNFLIGIDGKGVRFSHILKY